MSIVSFVYSFISFIRIQGRNGNKIVLEEVFIKKTKIYVKGKDNYIFIKKGNRLSNCILHITGNNCEIFIDEHCILSNMEFWIEDDGGRIIIGCQTTMEGGHLAATEGKLIIIGSDCMFSYGIEIRNGDSHAIFDLESNIRINEAKSISIGNHVWLGAHCKLLKGAAIGSNSIVASGAIVTSKLVNMNSVYGGIPAKKLKSNINWKRQRNE